MKKLSDGMTANPGEWVLDVRVGLVDSVPEIWRLLELQASLTLGQVHRILQVAFGWEDAHLHRFTDSDPFARLRPMDGEIPDTLQWMPQDWCEEPTDLPEEDCSLGQLLVRGSGAAFYEYDFGDSWLHHIEMVSRRPADEATPPARLTDGARRGPLEDSGGLSGYESILDALADPTHPDHTGYSEWVTAVKNSDEPFDPDLLDIAEVNRTLGGI
ncbi:plasmid pRiA4b ORF-3 family protein [Pseudarthrobacter sp. RMG13]|uniref:Plasmid pRiA4b ORF-3 family protein n=1 Tax=Pseudarthrobacter humi TaxID=2952523 RepID=A0ABT1LW81_9MICC|nr:plasmid pRiA4b ORF-3 family protein [Pseudarthrobacter humi]MCP9001888.1 plasmid pRiA4b ORF-3 family protein [Pseudarthrobacter humi]